jgi:monoamine oxidase
MKEYDVLIIGAGAAGLIAAEEISSTGRTVAILEARNRIGGRIHSIQPKGFTIPIEAGAEFVHGDLELTLLKLKKAGADCYELDGELWQKEDELKKQEDFVEDYGEIIKKLKELEKDISVSDFLEQHLKGEQFEEARFSLKNYVEGYYAADIHRASSFCLRNELENSEDVQYRIEGGYQRLLDYFEKTMTEKKVALHLSSPVREVKWQEGTVEVITATESYIGKKLLVTISLGVLQHGGIQFSPALPEKLNAAKQLGYGAVIKIIIEFNSPFWKDKKFTGGKDLKEMQFIFSGEHVPTWWSAYPKENTVLTGWLGGPRAIKYNNQSDEELLSIAFTSLANIFNLEKNKLENEVKAAAVFNWQKDEYMRGAYSFEVVNGSEYRRILKDPVERTIYFAGEALFDGIENGTVEAALNNGRECAFEIIASF